MKISILAVTVFLFTSHCFAWGKQGHAIINQTAALVLSNSEDRDFLREHAYDFSYFSNVPDISWKREKTFKLEEAEHFMDMEIFERELKIPNKLGSQPAKLHEAFLLDREEFDSKYPNISRKAGRSWWRIREIYDQLHKQSQFLADKKIPTEDRHQLQAQWIVLAGILGHYVGDLSQPLHNTENYDGQLTSQKGIHSYFEDKMVNLLIPKLSDDVYKKALKLWPDFTKRYQDLSTLTLISNLTHNSRLQLKNLIAIDKKHKRKNKLENSKYFHDLIVDQLAQGSLTLAELWRRNLDWKFHGQFFYNFISDPEYISAGTVKSNHVEEIKSAK